MGRKSKEQYEYELQLPSAINDYKKSNTLINSKGRASLLCQKLFAVGMCYAQYDEKKNAMAAKMYGTQLKKILGTQSGSLYERIKQLTIPEKDKPTLTDWKIIVFNDDEQKLDVLNVIQRATFENGELSFIYNTDLTQYLYNVKGNYTVLSLTESLKLNSMYSFKLYEVLKSKMDFYRAREKRKTGPVVWDINITEFKVLVGIIDHQISQDIFKILNSTNPDYERIEEIAEEYYEKEKAAGNDDVTIYKEYKDLNRRVITPALNELNKKTGLNVEFEPIKSGRGAKVKMLRFIIDNKQTEEEVVEEVKNLSEEEKMDFLFDLKDELEDIVDCKFKSKDLKSIAEAADYDLEKIKMAARVLSQAGEVRNVTGFMIKAIQEDYELIGAKSASKNIFLSFKQNDYDLKTLEEQLLDN